MESWNCILRNISEKVGHNLSSEGRMSLFLFGCVWLFATPWTVACQAPLLMGFPQVRILEWVAISFSEGSFQSRDLTCISWIGGQIPYQWATWEAPRISLGSWKKRIHLMGWLWQTTRLWDGGAMEHLKQKNGGIAKSKVV